jgi:hypothetical protein
MRFICIHSTKIPFLDICHGVSLNDGCHVCFFPRSQDEVFTGREFRLTHACQRTLSNDWLDDSRHVSSMADLIAFPRLARR